MIDARFFRTISILLVMTVALCAADLSSAETYTQVGITLNEMMGNPEGFCDYASHNASIFNNEFLVCLGMNIDKREVEADRIWDECTAIHSDPDFRNACFEENGGVELENQIAWLSIMNNAIFDSPNCSLHLLPVFESKDAWIDLGGTEASWDEFWAAARTGMVNGYACGSDTEDEDWWEVCFIRTLDWSW